MHNRRRRLFSHSLIALVLLALLAAGCDLAPPSGDADAAQSASDVSDREAVPAAGDTTNDAGIADDVDLPPITARPSEEFGCDGVDVAPGDDLAAVADRSAPGTTFCIRSGIHRTGEVLAQSGDEFVGESGAVLNGARDVSADAVEWRRSGDGWVVGGQTQQSEPLTLCHHADKGCIEGAGAGIHPNMRNEELFVDNRRLQHVASRSDLGPGRWHFDYGSDQIWLGEDPAALGTIETTVHQGAIGSDNASDVVVDNLVVEKYGSVPGRGALGGWDAGTRDKTSDFRWRFSNITGRLNHGAAVLLMEGDRLENCKLTHNGQLGFKALGNRNEANDQPYPKGFDQRVIIRNCEIAHNNQLNYRTGWEAGGFKIGQAPAGSVVENVWSHDNRGAGMWWDGFNRNAVVRSNLVEDNTEEGIMYELGYGGTEIYWNIVRDNGANADDEYSSKGIYLSNAEGTEVFENAVEGSNMAIHIRATGGRDPVTRDNKVFSNDFKPVADRACNGVGTFQGASPGAGNEFRDNVWRLSDPGDEVICWGDGQRSRMTVAESPADDRVVGAGAATTLPESATPFDKQAFGAR
ncbi:hypothetical protein BH23ACT10_BH23ACT10_06960 [soil metagenome]